jgi:signal transduction histidine kinase
MLEAYRLTEARARHADKFSALENLAAGLAHEIRNPLNGAQLHLVILERAIEAKSSEQDTLQAARVVAVQIQRVASRLTEFWTSHGRSHRSWSR